MPLARISFQPGINRESTQYSAGPGWYDCDKIRFRKGLPEQLGGWVKYATSAIKGIGRSLFDWGTAEAELYIGIGTNLKFYVENGGAYYDITPIRLTTSAGDATFSASDGSTTLTVSETGHGAVVGDYVTFSGAVTLGGNITAAVLNQEYRILAITDANTFTVTAKDSNGDPVTANASDSGNGGGSVVAAYQINTGINTYVGSTGYGAGTYGSSSWGGSGTLSVSGQLRLWSQDAFGDDLLFCSRAGAIYYWDESGGLSGNPGVDITTMGGASDAPERALQIIVSPTDRHVIALGTNPIGSSTIDPLLVRWSDQESAVDWTPTATNSSGGQVLAHGTTIIGGVRTRAGIVIFTDTSIHMMQFTGSSFVFNFSLLAENITAISPNAMVAAGDSVFFMSRRGFHVYNGTVVNLPCTVLDYVFSNINYEQAFKSFAVYNPDNDEIWWFYPSGSEIDRYVIYNLDENVWAIGSMERGAWIPAQTRSYPVATGIDTDNIETNYMYNHEYGYTADGNDLAPYIESGEFAIGEGDSFAFVSRVIPDIKTKGEAASLNMTLSIKGTNYPLDGVSTLATSPIDNTSQQCHVRVRARDVVLRLDGSGTGYGWTLGQFRFDMRTDGRR